MKVTLCAIPLRSAGDNPPPFIFKNEKFKHKEFTTLNSVKSQILSSYNMIWWSI